MKAFKYISIVFILFFTFLFTQTVLAWVESFAGPIYDPIITAEKAYFPSVLKMGANDYRMWYQSNSTPNNTTVAYATSADGLSWTLVTNTVSGLIADNSGHPHVEFADGKYRIWYWNSVSPYTNNALHYAESTDGITWTNDSAITGNLITPTGGLWNSGSYGAVDVIINNSPTNIGTNPFDYKYAMYYDATSGGYEQIALGYSVDGIAWTLYGTGPVLPKGLSGSWDSGYVTAGTVINNDGNWEMWYSGGISASNEGIGYATSVDGLTWTKSITNPFMTKNDGVAWRNNRTYTPSVIKDGNDYKMWFTGRDTGGNYAIGYATLAGPVLPATINIVKTVVNNNGGTKAVSDFPLFVNGTLVISGVTNTFPVGSYAITETTDPNYTQSFSGDCPDGNINLVPGDNKFCIITNNGTAPVITNPKGSGGLIIPVPPLMDLVKIPNPLSLPNGPGQVIYTYTLRNIGTVPVSNITMVGDTCNPITLTSGDTNSDSKLDTTETWTYVCSQNLTKTTTNTITATGSANGISAVDIASATVVVGIPGLPDTGVVPPLIHVTKVPYPLLLPVGGGIITYTEKITNPGIVSLSNVRLADDKCPSTQYISGDTNGDLKLDTNETWIYTCKSNLTQTTTNTVSVSGDANGLTTRDLAIVTVVVASPKLPNTGAFLSQTLRVGSKGTDVIALQNALLKKGFLSGIVDGSFGPITRAAVMKYQTSVGLKSDGIFGLLTRAKLIP